MPLVKPLQVRERRHALVLGTAHYADDSWADIAAGVLAEVKEAERLLLRELGYAEDDIAALATRNIIAGPQQ